jgi:glucose-1-phosphate cytidylyltransferase
VTSADAGLPTLPGARIEGHISMSEREPIEQLARAGESLVYRHEGFLYAMITYRKHQASNRMWGQGQASWKVRSR